MMRRLVVAAAFLALPASANGPTVEDALIAYANAGWEEHLIANKPMMCIEHVKSERASKSERVDRIVLWLAHRAKAQCS